MELDLCKLPAPLPGCSSIREAGGPTPILLLGAVGKTGESAQSPQLGGDAGDRNAGVEL